MGVSLFYSRQAYNKITKGLNGSLVCRTYPHIRYGEEKCGVGVVLDHRYWAGQIHYKIGWIISPYSFNKEPRIKEWVCSSALFILSKAKEELS